MQAQLKLLKQVKVSEELEMSWWSISAYVSPLQLKDCEREENEIVAEERSSLPSGEPAVQGYYRSKTAETLTLFQIEARSGCCKIPWITIQNGRMKTV